MGRTAKRAKAPSSASAVPPAGSVVTQRHTADRGVSFRRRGTARWQTPMCPWTARVAPTAKPARDRRSVIVALRAAFVGVRLDTVRPDASLGLAPALAPGIFPWMGAAGRTGRHARAPPLAIVAHPAAIAGRRVPTAEPAVRPRSALARGRVTYQRTGAVGRTEKRAKTLRLATAARRAGIAGRPARIAVRAAKAPLGPATAVPATCQLMEVVERMARLVPGLPLGLVARAMGTVGIPTPIVAKDGKVFGLFFAPSLREPLHEDHAAKLFHSQKSSSSGCLTTNIPSKDGTCGSKSGLTCAGGDFNNQCCSSNGFCGTSASHCGSGW